MGDDKITFSLGFKEWVMVVGAIVAVTGYVIKNEFTVKDHSLFIAKAKADSVNVWQDRTVQRHEWRLRRIERRLKIDRGRYGPERREDE